MLLTVLVLAVLLFAFSFRRRVIHTIRQGLVFAVEGLLSALAVLMTWVGTSLVFLFDRLTPQIGFYLCVGSWILLYLLSMFAAIRRYSEARDGCMVTPPPWGMTVAILVIVVVTITIWISEPSGIAELVGGIFATVLVGAPIVLFAMLLATRYRLKREEAAGV
jgi:hypothetical protein